MLRVYVRHQGAVYVVDLYAALQGVFDIAAAWQFTDDPQAKLHPDHAGEFLRAVVAACVLNGGAVILAQESVFA